MAKNTHAQEAATGTSDSYTAEEAGDWETIVANRPQLGEVKEDRPSVGSNSETSSESPETRSDSNSPDPQAGAPGAGNLSSPEKTGGPSDASSTGTATRKTGRGSASRTTRKTNSTQDEDFDF